MAAREARGHPVDPKLTLSPHHLVSLMMESRDFKAFSATGLRPPRKEQCVYRAETPLWWKGLGDRAAWEPEQSCVFLLPWSVAMGA